MMYGNHEQRAGRVHYSNDGRYVTEVETDADAICCFPGCRRYTSYRTDDECHWGIQFCDPRANDPETDEPNHYLMFEEQVKNGPNHVTLWCQSLGIEIGVRGTCGNCGNECRKPPGEYLCRECRGCRA